MKLVLGSKSPRRQELLKGMGFDFEIRTKDTNEYFDPSMDPRSVPEFLADLKAQALLADAAHDEVLITSDTIVLIDDDILGKPADESDAFAMLKRLSGRKHEVITGVQLTSLNKKTSFSVCTEVFFRELSDAEIRYYIAQHRPFDKAGAYGIQEWIGYVAVERLHGSYFNVVGLPTAELYQAIHSF